MRPNSKSLFTRRNTPVNTRIAKARSRPALEVLEDRSVPSAVSFVDGVVTVDGEDQVCIWRERRNAVEDDYLHVVVGSLCEGRERQPESPFYYPGVAFLTADVTKIVVNGTAGDDTLMLDHTNLYGVGEDYFIPSLMNTLVAKPGGLLITYNGGAGHDEFHEKGNSGAGDVSEKYNALWRNPADGFAPGNARMFIDSIHGTSEVRLKDVDEVVDTLTALLLETYQDANHASLSFLNGRDVGDIRTSLLNSVVEEGADPTTFVPIHLSMKTELTINGTDGDDTFLLNNSVVPDGLEVWNIDGGVGTDCIIFGVGQFPDPKPNQWNIEVCMELEE